MPGQDWVQSFKAQISDRVFTNIKRSRASPSKSDYDIYFQNLKDSLDSVASEAIFDYDETYLTDDPGKKKSLCKMSL